MKRTKSLVVLLVIAALVFSFAAMASAAPTSGTQIFSDLVGKDYAAKVAKLRALDVINGYPDGTFKPDNPITRAEFAKMADVLAGLKSLGEGSKNIVRFKDVPAGQWYTGWVAVAGSREFVKGYPDGTFKPDANITQAEVITVIMRILGYNDNLTGNWPYDYLSEAARIGLTDDITLDAGANASRAVVAILMNQALEENVVDYESDKNLFNKRYREGVPITLLQDVFEGALTEKAFAIDWQKRDNTFKLRVVPKTNDKGYDIDEARYLDVADNVFIDGANNIAGLEGKIIDYIYDTDDDEIDFITVRNYGVKLDTDAELTFSGNNLTKVKIDGTNYDVNDDAIAWDVYLNGYVDADNLKDAADPEMSALNGGVRKWNPERIIAVLNEDGDIVGIAGKSMGKPAVASEVTASKRIKTETNGTQTIPTDLNESDVDYVVIRDGKFVDLSEIKAGDLVWIYDANKPANLSKGQDYRILVSSAYVEGKLEEVNTARDSVTVGGKKSDAFNLVISTDNGDTFADINDNDLDDLMDETVKVYFDPLGIARVIVGDSDGISSGKAMYGVVTDYTVSNSVSNPKVTEIEILKSDNTQVIYKTNGDSADAARDVESGAAKEFSVGSFVKFTLTSDNYIDGFKVLDNKTATLADVDTDNDRIKLTNSSDNGWYKTDSIVVFDCSAADPDDWEVVSYKDLENTIDDGGAIDNAKYYVDSNELKYVVVTTDLGGTSDYAMVMGTGRNSDGDFVKLNINGTVKLYNVKDDVDLVGNDIKEGDLVTYKTSGGDVSELTVVVEEDETSTDVVDDVDTKGKQFKVKHEDGTTEWYTIDADTVIFDWSDHDGDPAYITLEDIADGDKVVVGDEDGDNIAEYVVLVE